MAEIQDFEYGSVHLCECLGLASPSFTRCRQMTGAPCLAHSENRDRVFESMNVYLILSLCIFHA